MGGDRGGKVALIAAISERAGMFHNEIDLHSTTAGILRGFMSVLNALSEDEPVIILLTNVPCHRGVQESFPYT